MKPQPGGEGLPDSRPRTCFLVQAGFGTAFTYLTSGVFLSGLAILMGAGDILVSYLSVIVNICGVLILIFPAFLERFTSRKRMTVALTILSRLATLFLVTIPVLFPARMQLYVFVPTVVAAFALQAQTTVVLNQWMLGFIDEKKERPVHFSKTDADAHGHSGSVAGWRPFYGSHERKIHRFRHPVCRCGPDGNL